MKPSITLDRYLSCFRMWADVNSHLATEDKKILLESIEKMETSHLKDGVGRSPDVYCNEFSKVLRDTGGYGNLIFAISKSCLLLRLIYEGEAIPRTRRCPKHNGRWAGIGFRNRCPHGCDLACGQMTGWLPEMPEVLSSYQGAWDLIERMQKIPPKGADAEALAKRISDLGSRDPKWSPANVDAGIEEVLRLQTFLMGMDPFNQ